VPASVSAANQIMLSFELQFPVSISVPLLHAPLRISFRRVLPQLLQ